MATRMAIKKCVACGNQFMGGNRASLCPVCRKKAHDGKLTIEKLLKITGKAEVRNTKRKSLIAERQREAASYGLSYGMYQSLRLIGQLQPRPIVKYTSPSWLVWKKTIYDTVEACRRRAQARKRSGGYVRSKRFPFTCGQRQQK